ncbi:putative anthocyanidin reductase [Senna tora]|uniref:Putative anthocyanidin reductase n=1 Tax=Senna tora TaxID=362788 RepID=A0A835CIH6_9FABA|nr:putative anthocyanidin reductase [Senna tora]
MFTSQLKDFEMAFYSMRFLEELLGKIPIVHIDDACEAHIFCIENPSIKGRFLVASSYVSTLDIANYYLQSYQEFHVKQNEGCLERSKIDLDTDNEFPNWLKTTVTSKAQSTLGEGDSLKAEIWAISLGLKATCSLHCDHLIVETDFQVAKSLILRTDIPNSHHLFPIFISCKESIQDISRVEFHHIFREGNSCADHIAKQVFLEKTPFTNFDSIPPGVSNNILADRMGISFPRRFNN